MMTSKPVLIAAALLAVAFTHQVSAQDAVTGNSFAYPAAADCNQCQSTTNGGIGSGGLFGGERMEYWRSKHDYYHKLNAKIVARNDAWPKPFACFDKQSYFNVWTPMLDSGYEEHCILSAAFFNTETNQLNQLGIHKVAGIMQNMPSERKAVFISRGSDEQVDQARLEAVKETIDTYYRQFGIATVAMTNRAPNIISGTAADAMAVKRMGAMPTPVIQTGSADSVNASVGGN